MSNEKVTIEANESWHDSETPVVDGNWIRNVLVLGTNSTNSWNPKVDPAGVKRDYSKVVATEEQFIKFDDKPSYILHKPGVKRTKKETLGQFHNPRTSEKGLRMDLECCENIQTQALMDNINNKRAFGGFSPHFDLTVNRLSGVVEEVDAVYSIDLVPYPGTVKSAVENCDVTEYITSKEYSELCNRVLALEQNDEDDVQEAAPVKEEPEVETRVEPIPEPKKKSLAVDLFKLIRE